MIERKIESKGRIKENLKWYFKVSKGNWSLAIVRDWFFIKNSDFEISINVTFVVFTIVRRDRVTKFYFAAKNIFYRWETTHLLHFAWANFGDARRLDTRQKIKLRRQEKIIMQTRRDGFYRETLTRGAKWTIVNEKLWKRNT